MPTAGRFARRVAYLSSMRWRSPDGTLLAFFLASKRTSVLIT